MKTKYKVVVITVIIVITLLLLIQAYSKGITGDTSDKSVRICRDIDELLKATPFEIELPLFLYEEEELTSGVILSQFIEIYNDNLWLRASIFVNNNADPLGIYDKELMEHRVFTPYKSSNSDINFVRYRVDSEGRSIINWCSDDVAYGIRFNDYISIDDCFKLIDLDMDAYEERGLEYTRENSLLYGEVEAKVEGKAVYDINNVYYEIFVDESKITREDSIDASFYYINNTMVLIVAMDNTDQYKENYYKESSVPTKLIEQDGISFMYLQNNPFKDGTEEYNTFEDMVNSIKYTIESVRVNE